MLDRVCVKDNIINNVLTLVTPVSNDTLVAKLHFAALNPLMLTLLREIIFQFNYTIQTTIRRHKLKNRIHDQSAPKLTLKGGGFKAGKNSKLAMS
jgi:hypothetical protein